MTTRTLRYLPLIAFGLPFVALASGIASTEVGSLATDAIDLINGYLVPLIFAIAFIVFLFGVAQAYIISRGNEEAVKRGHKLILWGLIGFAVMLSIWGLVNLVTDTFGLTGQEAGNGELPQGPSTSGT